MVRMHGCVFVPAKLIARMAESGMSTQTLAEKSGLSHRNLRRLEMGLRPQPRDVTLARIALALDCELADLCETRRRFVPTKLTARRAALGLTSRALADRSGVSYREVRRLELGQRADPGADVLARLARALLCTTDDLTAPHREDVAA